MPTPRIVLKSDGAILFGDHISCDGFAYDRKFRVQTHIHSDHMSGFDTSKANQFILASHETRALLNALRNADLPSRSNLSSIASRTCFPANGSIIEFLPSGHMLGSVQVRVLYSDGYKAGYSSDFFWPLEDVIEVDELLVDSTNGSPDCARTYQQSQVDEHVLAVVANSLRAGAPTAIIGHHGRVEYAVHLLSDIAKAPILCSPKVYALQQVYANHGVSMPPVICCDSPAGMEILRSRQPCLAFVSLPERRHFPWVDRFSKITLSAYMTGTDGPLVSYGNGDYRIAFTDHADFEGTIQYVAATRAKTVWTDPRSGNAEALATALRQRLGINALPAERLQSLSWG